MSKPSGRQAHLTNRSNQLNPSHPAYHQSRGHAAPSGAGLHAAGRAHGEARRAPETQAQIARDHRAAQISRSRQGK